MADERDDAEDDMSPDATSTTYDAIMAVHRPAVLAAVRALLAAGESPRDYVVVVAHPSSAAYADAADALGASGTTGRDGTVVCPYPLGDSLRTFGENVALAACLAQDPGPDGFLLLLMHSDREVEVAPMRVVRRTGGN